MQNHEAGHMALFSFASKSFFMLTQRLSTGETVIMKHSKVEDILTSDGRELLRRLFEEHIDLRDIGNVGEYVIGADNIIRTHRRMRERTLITMFGEVNIKRLGYGSRGHSSLFPKDAILNLPEDSYSYGIRKLVAQEAAKSPFSEVVNLVKQITGISLSKNAAEILANKAAVDFDAFYTKCEVKNALKTQNSLLILTTDGKGIVMRKEDLREHTSLKKGNQKEKKQMLKGWQL
jgi:hypothetical protein